MAKTSPTGFLQTFGSAIPPKYSRLAKYAIAAVIVLAILLGALVFLANSAISSIRLSAVPAVSGPIGENISAISSGGLAYNFSKSVVEYAHFRYAFDNVTTANMSLNVYLKNPDLRIYLVNTGSYCVQCPLGSSLDLALNSYLSKYGLIVNSSSFNYIDINKIDSVPPDSVIIIASGLFPNALLPNVTYTERCPKYITSNVISLLDNGDIIVYVGQSLSRSVTCGGQIVQTENSTSSSIFPLSDSIPATKFTNGSLYLSNPTFFFGDGSVYDSVGYIPYSNGTFIALSNYFPSGWNNNVDLLASDIAKVLAARFWMSKVAYGNYTINTSEDHLDGNLTLLTLDMYLTNSTSVSSEVNDTYPMLTFELNNSQRYLQRSIFLHTNYSYMGQINMPETLGQGQPTQVTAQVFSTKSVVVARMQLYNLNFSQTATQPMLFGQVGPTPVFLYPSFSLPSGYYIAKLLDQYNTAYASTLFYVANSTITASSLDFKNGSFVFYAMSDGAPVSSGTYSINLDGAYNSTGEISNGTIYYTLPRGTVVNYGTKTFNIDLFGNSYSNTYAYQNKGIVIPSFYIEFAIAAVFIIALNKVLVPPNMDDYYIDVPDIRPVEKQQVKENSEVVLGVFDSVNTYYHWRYVPLSVEEVRSGISNYIKYGNTRISITLSNTYAVLSKLISEGQVEEVFEYYLPKKWIKESGYSAEYLTIYRKLRDFCIANSMMFTEIGTTDKADMIITNKGIQNYVKIYTSDVKIKIMPVGTNTKTIFAFLNEDNRLSFMEKLYRSYGQNAEILKMAIECGNVLAVDLDTLEQIKHG
ncbi:MAG: hypothetical protein M1569_00835 [Candidatus Marsarchaeota archaeon]|nr:hypothetical protein [Candidatus Marsarchaeota archaeon]MCL5412933.1 hypothetical protein [Candidatus Marsarchaeota archaeon]